MCDSANTGGNGRVATRRTRRVRHRVTRSMASVAVGGLLLVAGCGHTNAASSGDSTTDAVTPATTPTVLACPEANRSVVAPGFVPGSDAGPAQSADDAMVSFLASDEGDFVRGVSFSPAPAPDSSVTGSDVPEASSDGSAAPRPSQQWYAHADADGNVTALLVASQTGDGWQVSMVVQCVTDFGDESNVSTTTVTP